jgi:serine/threonine-protein kinase
MAKSPGDRFESPEGFARSLAQFLASTGTPSSTHELAEFIRGLPMPRLPSELGEQDTQIRGRLPGSFSLKGMPLLEGPRPAPDAEAFQSEWAPTGLSLDPSGELMGANPVSPPHPESPQFEQSDRLELAYDPSPQALAPTAISRTDTRSWDSLPSEGGVGKRDLRLGGVLKWTALAAVAVGCVLERPRIYQWVLDGADLLGVSLQKPQPLLGHRASPVLTIESEPSGATVRIGDQKLGETPLFIENLYRKGDVEVRLSLRGYQLWTGKFPGGQASELKAKLRRR